MRSIFILSLLMCVTFTSAQLNQLDTAGKKDGKWIVYLDKNWKRIEDSTKASYCRYSYFDHGVHIYPMGPCGLKDYKLEGGKTKLLEGEYKWYDEKGRLSSVHVFKNGEYVFCKEYFKTGELEQYFDYTKKCDNGQHGWNFTAYEKNGKVKISNMTCKQNGKWPEMRD